ncbi:hypothetical protein RIF23_05765 [Lipingzhangella sp. LS1_29]|uniref:N-acetylmuramoyl-L-alanine amidase n=1 Tax=Lipingzhangella rawalii TaxID=2055835 RepID=A0ABU2H4L2_9ACTN|nr:hypothetical protein [Lipingzhangella rawalii]MDS1269799.1 hypothetical protein [Lipingzhangella rawalii]
MGVNWITRGSLGWGTTPAPHAPCDRGLVAHYHGESRLNLRNRPHTDCWRIWRQVRSWHVHGNGWLDIGYSYGVCPHAYTFVGRGFQRRQAAQPGGNTSWTSVYLFVGGSEPLTAVQLAQLAALRSNLGGRGIGAGTSIHSRFSATSCPGPTITAMHNDGSLWAGGDNGGGDLDMAEAHWYSTYPLADGYSPQQVPAGQTRAVLFDRSNNSNVDRNNRYASYAFANRKVTGHVTVRVRRAGTTGAFGDNEPGRWYLHYGRVDGAPAAHAEPDSAYLGHMGTTSHLTLPVTGQTFTDQRMRSYVTAYDHDLEITAARVYTWQAER